MNEYYISWFERTKKCVRVCADNKDDALRNALNTIAFCETNYVTDGNEIKDIVNDIRFDTFNFTDEKARTIEKIDAEYVFDMYEEI